MQPKFDELKKITAEPIITRVIEDAIQLFDVKRRRREIELIRTIAADMGANIPYPSALMALIDEPDRYYEIFIEIAITHVHPKKNPRSFAAICLVPSKDFRLTFSNHARISRTSYTTLTIISNLIAGNLNEKIQKQIDHFISTEQIAGPNLYFRKAFQPHPHMDYLFKRTPAARDEELLNIYLHTMNYATRHLFNILESPFILEITPGHSSIHELIEGFIEMVTSQEYELKLGHGRIDTARCYQL